MTMSVGSQAYIFLCSVAGGMAVALIYDFFRISRKAVKTGNLMIYIEDLLYWLIAAVVIFMTVYYGNEGELRSYLFIGALLGALLYALLFSRPVMNSSMFLINILKRIIKAIFFILFFPFKIFFRICRTPVRLASKYAGKTLRSIRRAGRNRLSMASLWKKTFKNIRKKI